MWGSFFMMATYMKEGDSFFSFDLWKKTDCLRVDAVCFN